jgi:hypothetical protein
MGRPAAVLLLLATAALAPRPAFGEGGQGAKPPAAAPEADREVSLMTKRLPEWSLGSVDFYYRRFGTLAMRDAAGDEDGKVWRLAMERALIPRQVGEPGGCARGSWDAADPWQDEGGRVYSAAMAALALEACARPLKRKQGDARGD